MKKILIIGIVASGKTTLAKQLSQTISIPWYELDCVVYHQTPEGRIKRTADEQLVVIEEINRNETWIFEGTDRDSYQCLYEMADTIIFLDPPLWRRRVRIFTRFLKQKLGIEACHYHPDLKMLYMMYVWTRDFERDRERFEAKLHSYQSKMIKLSHNNNLQELLKR
ncbi:hypothetical protein D3P07_04895 [Paenibacillus sp. 1011MAR3C5]|uniref:hypothetical protein n=1 Tax=Paenibacillus sp. 1011MAR3C5 TaxID=1675787 RepID=UPI000E6C6A77|nr:hypothetical protein [Paenibacillus sp. 1011MAR3C5]RJE89586.1 hypothetical protein D3P07_04895 [Paenibacillus sp. 1011MAR3C5]